MRILPDFIKKRLEGRETLQKTVHNTGWMMGDQIIRQGVGFLVGVWLARYLGPQMYGEFSYAIAVVMIVAPLAMLGLDDITIRRLVREPTERDKTLGTVFILILLGGLFTFVLALVAVQLARPGDNLVRWLVGIMAAATIFRAFHAIEFWFESQMQWQYTVYGRTSAFLLISLIKVTLIVLQAPLIAFAWAGLAETACGALGLLLVYRQRGYLLRNWRFSSILARSMLKDSWPLVCASLFTMIYLRIDQVMIGSLLGDEALGNYSVAVRISEVWAFIPIVICSATLPAIIEAETVSEEVFYGRLQQLYNLMVLLAYAFALPMTFFSDDIIQLIFTGAYQDAGPLLAVLAWTGVFTSLGVARTNLILAKNWTRVNLACVALGAILNIILNTLLIPRFGTMGAVGATFVSYWFAVHGTSLLLAPLRQTGRMMTKALIFPKVW
jgi:O-antigen/teichoic acid export membrane protein